MLLAPENGFVFLATPKAASTAIEQAFPPCATGLAQAHVMGVRLVEYRSVGTVVAFPVPVSDRHESRHHRLPFRTSCPSIGRLDVRPG